ncbi:MAG: agmatine deiminase family protein [Balneolaceae bacterium]|nr:agmatine deiminase family protein [Balneolaceae bacterium]
MPAEWYPHAATQLHWPSNPETWPDERLPRVESVYLEIIELLHRYEPIHLFVEDNEVYRRVLNLFENRDINLDRVTFHLQPINDVWARDCGPIFIRQNDNHDVFAITDWEYNAWGGKYPPYDDDNHLPKYMAEKFGIQRFEPGMVLEGGSIESNGDGVLMTTESVLLNPNRNPDMSKADIEQRLKEYLGVQQVIWLNRGLAGDDTDGHIDDIARFLNPSTILLMQVEDPEDVNYDALKENLEILKEATNQHGNTFAIETLPAAQHPH